MLSAFIARPIVEHKQRDKSKIESILAHGDRLFVGLNIGSLRIYRVHEVPSEDPAATDDPAQSVEADHEAELAAAPAASNSAELLRELEKFSKYKIEQLAIIREANILITLSNALVSIHDLQSYELQEHLTRTKGATAFAVNSYIVKDATTGVPSIVSRLAVAVKRRLLLWSWHDMELATEMTEIALASGIKTLTWASGTNIVAGLTASYVMVDVETEEITPIVGPGSIGGQAGQESSRLGGVGVGAMSYVGMGMTVPIPLATGLGEGEMLLAKDVNTHFIDRNGDALGRRQIPWRVAPEAIGYSYPYLLSLQEASKGILEVRNPETLSLLQSISLSGANILQVAQPNISLAHAGKGFLVASERVIWRMEALDYDSQIDALIEKGYPDEAISLLGMLEDTLVRDKQGRVREIKMQKAQKMFDEKRFRDSLDLFAEVSAPPERVIKLYPRLIAGDLAGDTSGPVEESTEATPSTPPKEPPSSKGHKRSDTGSTTMSSQSKAAPSNGHKKTTSTASGASPRKAANKPSVAALKKTTSDDRSETSSIRDDGNSSVAGSVLTEKELKAAVRELQAFLADIRRRLQRFFDRDQDVKDLEEVQKSASTGENFLQIIEYLLGVSSLNDIDIEEALLNLAKLVDTTLFRAYMFAAPSMAGSLFRIPNFCDPDVVMEKLEEIGRYNDLIDFLFGKRLHRSALELLQKFGQAPVSEDIDEHLRGPTRTVTYLQNLPPELIDLILEFARWPIQASPEMGMEIFLADTENAESLPRPKVLAFLESIDHALSLRYLEHVIDELNDMSPELHQKLAMLYFERLKDGYSSNSADLATDPAFQELHAKFLTLLRTSTQYSPAKLLGFLPRDDRTFFEPRAIIFSKLGQHKQALEIYVFKLRDPAKAEEYCNSVHRTSDASATKSLPPSRRKSTVDEGFDEGKPGIYSTLLHLYLSPPVGEKPMVSAAIEVLAKHGARLPAQETLEMIPSELLVRELEFYFRGRIRSEESLGREVRIVAGLRKVEAVRAQAELLLGETGRARNVRVDEERICGVCYKRLGGSVISVFPDNSVVHLGCVGRKQAEMAKGPGQ